MPLGWGLGSALCNVGHCAFKAAKAAWGLQRSQGRNAHPSQQRLALGHWAALHPVTPSGSRHTYWFLQCHEAAFKARSVQKASLPTASSAAATHRERFPLSRRAPLLFPPKFLLILILRDTSNFWQSESAQSCSLSSSVPILCVLVWELLQSRDEVGPTANLLKV